MIDTLGQRTEYGYDNQGNKLTQTDAEGRTTHWSYDDAGRVISRTLPGGQIESFTYNEVGNRQSHTDFNGKTTTYQYDLLNREVLKTYQDGTSVATTYTDSGQVDTLTDVEGVTDHDYDQMDRLTRITYPTGRTIAYGYDARGNRTRLTSGSRNVSYTYNALNQLESATEAGSGTTAYTYTPVGSIHTVLRPNGLVTTYSYDSQNRLKEQTTTDALGTALEQFTYTLDPTGQRTRLEELSGRTTTWAYNELYRLTEETVQDLVNGNRTTGWTYDKVGNRLTQTDNGATTTYTYDLNDRLQSESGARNVTYQYDDNGNTISKQGPDGETTYTYDDANRLIAVTTPIDSLAYSYDASGIRRSKTENGVTTNYLVDPNQAYAQVIGEYQNDTEQVWYTYGHDLLSQQRGDGVSYYHYDGLGSTRALSDDTGQLTDIYVYTAFGELETQTGSSENAYLYTGAQFDSTLDQYYLRARYYDQSLGRFPQMDTWQGTIWSPITQHKFVYADVNPCNGTDPSGLMTIMSLSIGNNISSSLRMGTTQSYRVVFKKTGCFVFEAVAEELITSGVYIFLEDFINPGRANTYAGRSSDFKRRINQHVGTKIKSIEKTMVRFGLQIDPELPKGIGRVLEQFIIDSLGGKDNLTNKRNEIAENPRSKASKELRKLLNKAKMCR